MAPAALGIVRLSGPAAWEIACQLIANPPPKLTPRHAYLVTLVLDADDERQRGGLAETALVTFFQAPETYTGADLVELSVHGNPLLVRAVVRACLEHGARPAEAGEFTYRAYLNGKLDLAQAEGVQELITAGSLQALRLAQSALAGVPSGVTRGWVERLTGLLAGIEVIHDYAADGLDASLDAAELTTPEQLRAALTELGGELEQALADSRRTAPLREGITVAITGPPNVGKSTLFNALVGHERALTAAEPGTTRDYITERLETGGVHLTLVDTAGYRDTRDALEAAGVRRAGDWAKSADRVLWVNAADRPPVPVPAGLAATEPLPVVTRCDLLPGWPTQMTGMPAGTIYVSGLTGKGVNELHAALAALAGAIGLPELAAFSERQARRLASAGAHLERAQLSLRQQLPLDAVAQDLYGARRDLHGIYEQVDHAQVVAQVFSRFCVGK